MVVLPSKPALKLGLAKRSLTGLKVRRCQITFWWDSLGRCAQVRTGNSGLAAASEDQIVCPVMRTLSRATRSGESFEVHTGENRF